MAATISQQVLDEIKSLRGDVAQLTKLLLGDPQKPEQIAVLERIRLLEMFQRTVKWIGGVFITALVVDIATRFLQLYRSAP